MIWRVRKPGAKNRAKHQWHNWFAWYPVRVPTKGRMSKQHKIWLKSVKRRGVLECVGMADYYWVWKYALPGDEYWEPPKYKTPKDPSGLGNEKILKEALQEIYDNAQFEINCCEKCGHAESIKDYDFVWIVKEALDKVK